MKEYNILYIHSHDTGRYIQPYGFNTASPRLQQLAEEGILFRQAFCANPTCSPSRASLLSGTYAHCNGMTGLAHRGFAMNDYSKHIINHLKGYGYRSALSGIQHIAHKSGGRAAHEIIGYDECLGGAEDAHKQAAEFLSRPQSRPFFLSVGFFETHREFLESHPRDNAGYCRPPLPLPDTPETREDTARYLESLRTLDEKIGCVLDSLKENRLAENTLVVCTTDHGIAFPSMKCNLTDHGTGVMLMMRLPGVVPEGKISDAMISHIDVFPTICDILQIEKPGHLQGASALPHITGKAENIREEVFAEVNFHAAVEPMRSVRTKRWKYIRRFEERRSPVLPNCDAGLSKDVWLEAGWRERSPETEQLYDLTFDPAEVRNRAGDPGCSAVLDDMRGRLQRWMEETDDPLLKGPLRAPSGARLNDPDGTHPGEPVKTVS